MNRVTALPMNGGVGDRSYAKNSALKQKVISLTWPITKEAITHLCSTIFPDVVVLRIADLGCSSGPNSFMVVSNLIKQVENIRPKLHNTNPLEYHVFLNDLPSNDFNAIFRALPSFLQDLKTQISTDVGPCFFTGVPGSFYDRLFPTKSIHFFHSSYSLHWLSQVPKGPESNKGNVLISRESPKSVLEAYFKQFQKDFSIFLKYRARELITGGCMVLTLMGRTTKDIYSKESGYIWELLTLALNDMVIEGRVEGEKADSFNIPLYLPSPSELEVEILNEGSFTINALEVSRTDWSFSNPECSPSTLPADSAHSVVNGIRAVAEPLLIRHFGETIIDELFNRYEEIVADRMSKERTEYINLTVSLTKIK